MPPSKSDMEDLEEPVIINGKDYTIEELALNNLELTDTKYLEYYMSSLRILMQFSEYSLMTAIVRYRPSFALVRTACICKDKIFIDPAFFLRVLNKNPWYLAGIILHELLHPIIDPNLFKEDDITSPPKDIIYNIFSDSIINALIYRIDSRLAEVFKVLFPTDNFFDILNASGKEPSWDRHLKIASADKNYILPGIKNINIRPNSSMKQAYVTLYISKGESVPTIDRLTRIFIPDIDQIREKINSQQITVVIQDGNNLEDSEGNPLSEMPGGNVIVINKNPLQSDVNNIDKNKLDQLPEKIKDKINKELQKISAEKNNLLKGNSPIDKLLESSEGRSDDGNLERKRIDIANRNQVIKKFKGNSTYEKIAASHAIKGLKSIPSKVISNNIPEKNFHNLKNFNPDSHIKDLFMDASEKDLRGTIVKDLAIVARPTKTVIPRYLTTSGVSTLGAGYIPTFWRKPLLSHLDVSNSSTLVYLDVSGSFWGQLPWAVGLLSEMKEKCKSKIFIFSTKIVEISLEDLIKNQEIDTTGGTSFQEVLSHFSEQDFGKCLIITDGDGGSVSKNTISSLKSANKQAYCLIMGGYMDKFEFPWAVKTYIKKDKRN